MNTSEIRVLRVEDVADLPVLWAKIQRLDLPALVDRHYPAPPQWTCLLSPGELLSIWLLFIISQGDHRLNALQPWVALHHGTLSALLGQSVLPVHAHDDRLADLLTRLGSATTFASLERDINQQTIRVYHLCTDTIRIDTTTVNTHADVVSEQGLVQFGHSKDDPDRPQLKVAAAVLDPLGTPLVTMVVPGNTSDDPLYIPVIRQVQQSVGVGCRTYVGDCKMAALATRAFVAAGGDFYLCPLSENQFGRVERQGLLAPVFTGTQALAAVYRPGGEGEPDELVAQGFSVDVELTAVVGDKQVHWTERRWLVRSVAYAQAQEMALERRLEKAAAELRELVVRRQGKKQLFHAELMEAAQAIVTRQGVDGLFVYTVQAKMHRRQVRAYRDRPARQESELFFEIDVQRNEALIAQKKREMGWQVYAVNNQAVTLSQVVWAYRGQYRIEEAWSRLKGRPLGLTPMYLTEEIRMAGLVNLLSLALRVLTLVEWEVREQLRQEDATLQGIYAGQPARKTERPSAELLLRTMKTIRLTVIELNDQTHVLVAPLTELQKRLLELWGLPPDLYDNLARAFPKLPENMSEP